jgi:hypothetical protein
MGQTNLSLQAMKTEFQIGDVVMFTGSTKEQTAWGGNDDPYQYFKEGDTAEIKSVDVHSYHTKLHFVGISGKFNSVCFRKVPSYINPKLKEVSKEELKKVLRELHEKQEAERLEMQESLNRAFNDGFRCGPRRL